MLKKRRQERRQTGQLDEGDLLLLVLFVLSMLVLFGGGAINNLCYLADRGW